MSGAQGATGGQCGWRGEAKGQVASDEGSHLTRVCAGKGVESESLSGHGPRWPGCSAGGDV